MIRPELADLLRRWAEPVVATLATLAALWIAGASTLRWGWVTIGLSIIVLVAGGLWIREAIRRVRLSLQGGNAGQVFVEERRVLYLGHFGNVQVDLDEVSRVDLVTSKPGRIIPLITGGSVPKGRIEIAKTPGRISASVMLYAINMPPVSIPLNAEGEDRFLDALCALPGFRLEKLEKAMARFETGKEVRPIVTIWQK